jgi:hypothetical protein
VGITFEDLIPARLVWLTLTELEPPFVQFVFAGRDRPEQDVPEGSRSQSQQTWYPGANKASVQDLGVVEEPIPFRGWFQDPASLLDGGPAARVAQLRGLHRRGNPIQLAWGQSWNKRGRITRTRFTWRREQQVRWEFTFEVDEAFEEVGDTNVVFFTSIASDVAKLALETADNVLTAVAVIGAVVE